MCRDAGRSENLGGRVVMWGPKIWGGEASSRGGAKIWGGGGCAPLTLRFRHPCGGGERGGGGGGGGARQARSGE